MGDHCDELLDKLFAFVDKELPEEELRAIAEHLEVCPPCEAERRIHERIKAMISCCPCEQAPEHLRKRVLAMIGEARDLG